MDKVAQRGYAVSIGRDFQDPTGKALGNLVWSHSWPSFWIKDLRCNLNYSMTILFPLKGIDLYYTGYKSWISAWKYYFSTIILILFHSLFSSSPPAVMYSPCPSVLCLCFAHLCSRWDCQINNILLLYFEGWH